MITLVANSVFVRFFKYFLFNWDSDKKIQTNCETIELFWELVVEGRTSFKFKFVRTIKTEPMIEPMIEPFDRVSRIRTVNKEIARHDKCKWK